MGTHGLEPSSGQAFADQRSDVRRDHGVSRTCEMVGYNESYRYVPRVLGHRDKILSDEMALKLHDVLLSVRG